MFTIDRLDKPIETVLIGGRLAITTTRSAAGEQITMLILCQHK